jgi:hypothetical protein
MSLPIIRRYSFLVVILCGIGFSHGCKQDIGGSAWDVDVLTPIISTRLTMADLLDDSIVQADANGALRLKFETDLIGLQIDSIVRIPDTTIITPISFALPITDLPPGSDFIPFIGRTRYDLGGISLKKVRLKRGKLRVKLRSVLPTPVEFFYEMPLAYLWGNHFQFSSTIDAGTDAVPATAEFEFDLTGYEFDLRSSTFQSFNTLESRYTLRTSENGQTVSVPANQAFFFLEYSFFDIVPDYGIGFFGQKNEQVEDEVSDLAVLSQITEGQLLLDSVTIDLSVVNGVGADALFRLGYLKSINTRTNTTLNLQHSIVGNNIQLTRAIDLDGTAAGVQISQQSFRLDKGNSNIKDLLENLPDKLGFAFDFSLNPLGNISSGNDFFFYDKPFEAKLAVNVPLRASIQNLTLVDTLEFNLAENAVVESITKGTFTLVAVNGFPLECNIEMVLLNESFQLLDTLVNNVSVAAPALNAEFKVVQPLESRVSIPLTEATAQRLPQANHVRLLVRFNSPAQPQLLDIYSHYGIDIKLIGDLNINFNSSGN